MARIGTPVKGFTGKVAGLDFEDGVASTDDERLIAYFTEAGYDVDASGYEVQHDEDRPPAVIGTVMLVDVAQPVLADAADHRNDLVPVGGVKDDGTIVAPAKDGDGNDVAPKPIPAAPVQETGNPDEHSAVPATANPDGAAIPPAGLQASGAPADQQDGTATTEPVPTSDDAGTGKHAADQPADSDTTADQSSAQDGKAAS